MGGVKVKNQVVNDHYAIYHSDCVEGIKGIPDNSVGFVIYSPPFASLYSYSDDDKDMGNCKTYDEFFKHYGFLVEEIHRVLMPGRIAAIHAMDIPTFQSKGEEIGVEDFPGDIIRLHKKKGFVYHCPRITIWKDPLVAATRTHAKGLAHQQLVKDSAALRTGIPDCILAFRKKGDNPVPIAHPNGLSDYAGSDPIPSGLNRFVNHDDPRTNKRSHWIWQRYASPVWMDIRQSRVLPFKAGKDKDDQRHLCPLQLDVIERCLTLWSAPGDKVLTPFMGVASEVYESVRLGRKGVGFEIKKSYFNQAIRNLESLKVKQETARLTK